MQKYEILYCLLAICFSSIAFKITIEDLTIPKVLKLKRLRLIFDGKKALVVVKKVKRKAAYYHNYRLPYVKVD